MSFRLYVNENCGPSDGPGTLYEESGERYFVVIHGEPRTFKAPSGIEPYLTRVTWQDKREIGRAYNYAYGIYRGDGWEVEITSGRDTEGYGKAQEVFNCYCINGSFPDVATMRAFEHELTYGNLLPTLSPDQNRKPSEEQYAKMCGEIISNRKYLDALEGMFHKIIGANLPMRMIELEGLIAAQANQLQAQGQQIQNLLTPRT